jgi:hypothetical protein
MFPIVFWLQFGWEVINFQENGKTVQNIKKPFCEGAASTASHFSHGQDGCRSYALLYLFTCSHIFHCSGITQGESGLLNV